jgi:RNA polymerase sigma factor (sigma-70 family)
MDRGLVERAIAGDHDAFAALARASADRLYAVARLILRDPERAQDATQEALVAAWRDLSALRDPDKFEGWLHRVLVHACYREARRERRRREVEIGELELEGARQDDVSMLAERDALERGFRKLDPQHRAVLVLHHYAGYSVPEIAELIDLPQGTVKSRLHRGARAMRVALGLPEPGAPVPEGRVS